MLTATVTDYLSDAPRSAPPVEIDQALARAAARGEIVAFETLYRRHVARAPVAADDPVTRNRFAPWALAASLLLAVTLVWQLQPSTRQLSSQPVSSSQAELIAHEAPAITRAYRDALQELTASAPAGIDANPALRELDQSAAQIRSALARDPDARFLLNRLRHTYALRLALTQRAALT